MKNPIQILLIVCVLFGCNPVKQAQRQDVKAVKRVQANVDLLSQMKEPVYRLWPPIPGTIKPGKVDSIPYPVYVPIDLTDTTVAKQYMDSVLNSKDSLCIDATLKAYMDGFEAARKKWMKTKIPIPAAPDTFVDNNMIYLLKDSLIRQQIRLEGAVHAADGYKKERDGLMWIIAGMLLAIVAGVLVAILNKLNFKSWISSLLGKGGGTT